MCISKVGDCWLALNAHDFMVFLCTALFGISSVAAALCYFLKFQMEIKDNAHNVKGFSSLRVARMIFGCQLWELGVILS